MSVEGLTLEVIVQEIGKNLQGGEYIISTTSSAGPSEGEKTSLIDNSLFGGIDIYNGWWVKVPGTGTNGGEISRVDDTEVDTPGTGDRDLTLRPGLTSDIPSAMPYELWKPEYPPVRAKDAVNRAINSVVGRFYKREESLALHGGYGVTRFDIPSEFDMIDRIERRFAVDSLLIHDGSSAFDESVDADFTVTADTSVVKRPGSSAVKFVIAGTVTSGDFASDSIGSLDISGMTHVECWIYVLGTTTASALDFTLDDTVNHTSPIEILSIPIITQDIWTFVRLPLANPENDTAIISIALRYNETFGNTVWLDDIRAVNEDTARWGKIPKHLWRIDSEAQDLVFIQPVGDYLLKISGGSNPAQMTTEAAVATLDEDFIIAQATAYLLSGGSRASRNDTDGRRTLGRDWARKATLALGRLAKLIDVRKVG